MASIENADILENTLRKAGDVLSILLCDQTTKKNIIWGTDSYEHYGQAFAADVQIKSKLVTGNVYGNLIQPRAVKSLEEQRQRTKEKGEVFTPLKIVDQMNMLVEPRIIDESNWRSYVAELKLEITCGEGPFIVSRYNPVAHGTLIKLENRVGFLDRKLQVVSKYCIDTKEWLKWAKIAFQSSYGYEWQGDSLLIARENLLYTLQDYYKELFGKTPSIKVQEEFAEIISWNIFQMDGLKYVVPMSCVQTKADVPDQPSFFEDNPVQVQLYECEGCKYGRLHKHNGVYVKIMDWEKGKAVRFVDLVA